MDSVELRTFEKQKKLYEKLKHQNTDMILSSIKYHHTQRLAYERNVREEIMEIDVRCEVLFNRFHKKHKKWKAKRKREAHKKVKCQ